MDLKMVYRWRGLLAALPVIFSVFCFVGECENAFVIWPLGVLLNPFYLANTLVILGAVVMSEVLWMIPVTLLWCALFYSLVVHFEEQHLAAKYGEEYLDYLRAAPRWWPRLGSPSGHAHFQSSCSEIVLAEAYVILIIAAPLVKEFIVAPLLE